MYAPKPVLRLLLSLFALAIWHLAHAADSAALPPSAAGASSSDNLEVETTWAPAKGVAWHLAYGLARIEDEDGVRALQPRQALELGGEFQFKRWQSAALPSLNVDGAANFNVEVRVHRLDGRVRDLRLLGRVSGQVSDLDLPWRLTGVCTDITERKATLIELTRRKGELEDLVAAHTADLSLLNEQLGHAARAKSELLSHISHEIRTPINAISGLTELVLRTPLEPPQRDYLQRTRQATELLLSLVENVLDFAKIEAGRIELDEAVFSLRELLDKVANVVGVRAQQNGLLLRLMLAEHLPKNFIGDSHRLSQVLINLCNNAIKFTQRGEVVLSVSGKPGDEGRQRLRFAVRDTGMGISPAQRRRLFQPFNQADASIARRFGGTGLGLVICQQLVALMGGRIDVNSRVELGSEFFFTLELRPDDSDAMAPAPATAAATEENVEGLRGKWVLVVDDDEVNRLMASTLLSSVAGMQVVLAEDGMQALAALQARDFDVVLMDMQMPVMGGCEAARAIRGDARYAALPIIALSADAQPADREQALKAGMSDYVTKPFRVPLLLATLNRWLGMAQG